ncbi:MAG: MarR family transcriptional regulator [Streptococcus sp.]|nr:MarR family transcriptional regulator [Streptococcus sp.]
MNYKETMSRLNKALNNIDSAYAKIAKKHGLTFNSLMMLYLLEESKKITQKQICDTLHLPKSTVHNILSDFIKQQYVTLIAGSNKKEKFVIFTEEGRVFFSKIFEETDRFEEKVLSSLGEETCLFLIETAEKLSGIIKDEIAEISDSEV